MSQLPLDEQHKYITGLCQDILEQYQHIPQGVFKTTTNDTTYTIRLGAYPVIFTKDYRMEVGGQYIELTDVVWSESSGARHTTRLRYYFHYASHLSDIAYTQLINLINEMTMVYNSVSIYQYLPGKNDL